MTSGRQREIDPIHIQIELQPERRSRSVPPTLASSDSGLSSRQDNNIFLRPLSSSRGDDHYNKIADQEMNTYTQALHLTRKKLVEVHEEVKSAREMSERAKSELLALEFKRGNASQELESLTNDITRKKGQILALDSDLQLKTEEVKNMRSLGLTREDCLEVKTVKEENVSLTSKLRSVEGLQLERDELVRQLESAKEDLFREQKLARARSDENQEVIETLTAKLEEMENNWRTDQAQIVKLETSFKRMEREKNELIQEKSHEYEELKASHRQESVESQNILKKELNNLDHEVQDLRAKVSDLQVELAVKDAMADKLRSEINEIGSVLDRERQDRQKSSSNHKNLLQHLKKETAAAVLKLKESMFLERQTALEDMKRELLEEKRDVAARSEDRLAQVLQDHSYQLADKNGELARLEDYIRDLESYKQAEIEEHVREAVTREREQAQLQSDRHIKHEREEEKKRITEMNSVIDKEKQTNRELLAEMTALRKELEEQKRQLRDSGKDKLVAVARAKDQMKEQGIAEVERIKFNLKQEHEAEIDRMKERLRDQDEEMARLKSEIEHVSERERLAVKGVEHLERLTVAEIHTQVQRVAGISSRSTHPTSIQFELADGRLSPSMGNRPAVNAALASLRTCIDEVQHQMSQLQLEQESLRMMVRTVSKEKEEAVSNCRLEMDRKRIQDLEKLKEKLLKEHVSEMSNVIRECAESNSQLKTNSQILQRYGDAALLQALQAKDDELQTMEMALAKWQNETEGKFNTQLQLQVAKEREKYQALQHHSTREQKRINDLQKREIDRLEKEVQKLAMPPSTPHDSNRFVTTPPSQRQNPVPSTPASASLPFPTPASNLKSSQQYLQNRIEQLQADNAALRKQRLLHNSHLSMSTSNLATPTRHAFPVGRSGSRPCSPSRDVQVMQRLGERIRQGQQETRQAEETAKLNQHIMNNKMEEMAKLQNTLIIQNQELQELERSYNDLQKHYHSRPGSPTRNLNITR